MFPIAALPSPVRYRGMPSPRFWTIEDATVNFGAINAPRESVITSLMIEFALCYGNDHIIPLQLQIGSICQVDSLVVTDTFGETVEIKHIGAPEIDGPAGPFRVFEHHTEDGTREPLFALFPP